MASLNEVLSDIRQQETDLQELVASARVGELPDGRAALNRPDLAQTPGWAGCRGRRWSCR
jgi:hypothetical protein